MQRSVSLAFGGIFSGLFLSLVRGGFTGLNAWDLAGTGTAAIVFLSQAIWPQLWERLTGRRAGEVPPVETSPL